MPRTEIAYWEQPSQQMAKFRAMFADIYGLMDSGDAAPVDAVRSSVALNPVGDDNGLLFTAVDYGASGDDITVAYLDPGANDAALSVDVEGNSVVVSLATEAAGAITSTAADVLAAVEASAAASAIVAVAIDAADAGVADDGSGVVTAMDAIHLEGGVDGTNAGVARPGGLYIDNNAGTVYRNSGSTAAPAWTALADAP